MAYNTKILPQHNVVYKEKAYPLILAQTPYLSPNPLILPHTPLS